jgi:HEAT repeat protein
MVRRIAGAALVAGLCAAGAAAPHGQQLTFEQTVAQLSNPDPRIRGRAVDLLKEAAYPEAAVPLAKIVTDPDDELQFDGIAAELNIFLTEKVTPKKRVGLVVEVRSKIEAEPIFAQGHTALGPHRVPKEVTAALTTAMRDRNLRVALEAVYAFGVLAGEVAAADRPAMLEGAGPILAGIIGAPDPALRLAAVRVAGRVWARRPFDPPLAETVGDAVIAALNDREAVIRETAMWAVGVMKNERSVQALGDLFQYYKKGPLATTALESLSRIGHPGSQPYFDMQLAGKNQLYKLMALEGMARTNEPAHLETIHASLAKEKNEALLLAGHFANAMLAEGSIDAIVDSLPRPKLHDQAATYIQDLAYGRTQLFANHLQDPDVRIRLELVDLLGLAGDVRAVPLIEPLLKDREADVAFAAARALARLGTTPPPA